MINNIKFVRPLIILIILISFIGLCSAESISGYVTDINGNPVNNVGISDNASIGTTNTNSTGYYYINGYINLSTYILSTSKSGYIDNTLSVDVNGNMSNANITISEKSSLYDIFQIMQGLINNVSVIVGMVIMAITISIVIFIGAWITKLLQKTTK